METLIEYIKSDYPEIIEEHKRKTTPFYYEPNVFYHPITNGMGCGSEGSNEPFEIINGTYHRNGEIHMSLQSATKSEHKICVSLSEAYKKLKRIDDLGVNENKVHGLTIPNSNQQIYMNNDGKDYSITQLYWRDYYSNKLGGRVIVTCLQDKPSIVYGSEKMPYYKLYSVNGDGDGCWNLEYVHSYDSIGREQYDMMYSITVKQFKSIVFGSHDVKLKCQLFGK